jgi:hypothetical protein
MTPSKKGPISALGTVLCEFANKSAFLPRCPFVSYFAAYTHKNVHMPVGRRLRHLRGLRAKPSLATCNHSLEWIAGRKFLAKPISSFFNGNIDFPGFCGAAHSLLKRLQHLTGAKTSASYPQMAGIACISAFFFFCAKR